VSKISASKTLVIVESPTKAKTIRGFLPRGFRVNASMGHVRDLPNSASEIPASHKGEPWAKLGVNTADGFQRLYVVPREKKKVVRELKDALKTADQLLLATDEDREGESISWHLLELLKPKVPVKRLVFHEITQEAIDRALPSPATLTRTWCRLRRRAGCWIAWWVTPSRPCCGKRWPTASPPDGCSP